MRLQPRTTIRLIVAVIAAKSGCTGRTWCSRWGGAQRADRRRADEPFERGAYGAGGAGAAVSRPRHQHERSYTKSFDRLRTNGHEVALTAVGRLDELGGHDEDEDATGGDAGGPALP